MHVQNREFKNTGFLPIWVFDSQQLEDHTMQRSMVRLSQTTRKCTVIMLLCYYILVLCLMNRNMKRRTSGNYNSYGFSFKETLMEPILQFSFAPFLCTKFMKSSTIGNFPIPMFFIHFSFQALAILVGRLLLLWTQATAILAQLPGPSTNAQLKRAEINNDGVQESPSRIAKLPGTSLLVI